MSTYCSADDRYKDLEHRLEKVERTLQAIAEAVGVPERPKGPMPLPRAAKVDRQLPW